MRRPSLLVVLVGLAACAPGERLILIPTGKKIGKNEIRTEFIFGGKPSLAQGFIGMGIGLQFDAELIYERISPNPQFGSLNFAYNYITPVTDVSPGISVGVRDALNRTADGRAFYIAATYRIASEVNAPAELTLGGGTESLRGLFVGAMLPLSDRIRLVGEHDSFRWTAGVEFRPFGGLVLKALFRQDRTMFSVGYSLRF